MRNCWDQLEKPIIALSPMDGVTDHPYRVIQKKYGRPDLLYTEFTSVEGVCHGARRLLKDFLYLESERPIVAQIYGTTPEFFRQTAILLCQLGFDGIDINMGCPAKNVAHSGAGAALIKTPQLAREITAATKQGVEDFLSGQRAKDCPNITAPIAQEIERRAIELPAKYQIPRQLPVSIKTRIGFNQNVVNEWIKHLLESEPSAIAIHGRTLAQQYGGEASWEAIGQAAELIRPTKTLVLGNGDLRDKDHALELIERYQLDGALIGRSSFGNPYVFLSQKEAVEAQKKVSRFELALEHTKLFEKTFSTDETYNFLPMRKHLGWYVRGVEGASAIRVELFQTNSSDEVQEILAKHQLI